jgi:beta-glucosidase
MLQYVQKRYLEPSGIPLIITENGFAVKDEPKMAKEECLRDAQRIAYYRGYLTQLLEAIKDDGLKCDGYFAWTIAE